MLADLRLVDEQHTYVQDLRLDQRMILRIAIEVLSKVSMIILYDPFASFTPSMMMNVGIGKEIVHLIIISLKIVIS